MKFIENVVRPQGAQIEELLVDDHHMKVFENLVRRNAVDVLSQVLGEIITFSRLSEKLHGLDASTIDGFCVCR